MDAYRLPRTVVPTRYDVRLEPDLENRSFRGHETVHLTVTAATCEFVLNAVELSIDEVMLDNDAGVRLAGSARQEDETERCWLTFPQQAPAGLWRLHISFRGTLNDKLRGFYRSTYKSAAGEQRLLAATQFEATDARRAFPCWDEPDFKAVFASTLVIDPKFTAVSNTSIFSESLENGRKVLRFADTMPMSSYLVAYVVGELEATAPGFVGQAPLRVWCVPGKRHLAAFGQEIGTFSLRFFEEYYDRPYPGDKLDLLAIPDFAAGAMENLGAITFRETALLVDEKTATHAELERVADVVAHENAHMWFGDLVTMSWWNGLWLNEAFATFMEMMAVDAWKPGWQRWTTFGVSRAAAFVVDGLNSTRPIEFPVAAPQDAEAMFDVLTYEKGASVLRMIEQFLGPNVFRAGVRAYLRKHEFANTETGDLWLALGQASNQQIPQIMDGWVFRPGYPLVSVRVEGGRLVISQQRFRYLPDSAAEEQLWHVPILVRLHANGQPRTHNLLLKGAEASLPLPAGFEAAVVNDGGHGFYRVRYSADLLERLLERLVDDLAPIERFNLVNDCWALVQAGLMSLVDYLQLTSRFRGERDKNVWTALIGTFYAIHRLVEPADRPRLESLIRDRLVPAITRLGWLPAHGEDELTRQLRGDLVRTLGSLGNDAGVQTRAAELYETVPTEASPIDANVAAACVTVLAHIGDETRYQHFRQCCQTARTPQEEQRYLYALTAFRQPELLQRTLASTLNGDIRTQDAGGVVRALLWNVHGRELAWKFIQEHWQEMSKSLPVTGYRRMYEGIIGLATPELEREVDAFFQNSGIDLGGKTLAQYREQLRIAVTLRERERQSLGDYLRSGAR